MRSGKHKATEGEGKHMKYSVYDIIYRNDSNIRRLLENDLLFAETGFVAFRDADGRFWYLYKKEGLLVPGQQDQINRTYGSRDPLSGNRKIRIGEAECDCALPTEECEGFLHRAEQDRQLCGLEHRESAMEDRKRVLRFI